MADIGDGYGSELLLLRYLGRHRQELNRSVNSVIGHGEIEWLDFHFDATTGLGDRELRGIEFLPAESPARGAWNGFWPRRGNPPNWDAIGRISNEERSALEWILVEAKGNVQEIRSSCSARGEEKGGGLQIITQSLARTKERLGVAPEHDWLNGYYQCANRLAFLDFLISAGEPAHMIFVYFVGDQNPGLECPVDEAGWSKALMEQDAHLGLLAGHTLSSRVHKLFLPANRGVGRKAPKSA